MITGEKLFHVGRKPYLCNLITQTSYCSLVFNMDEIVIIIGLILLNGIFSMSEVALISARKSKLATDVKRGSKTAKVALDLANEPDKFLSTVQIGITSIGILTGIFSGNKIALLLTSLLSDWGMAPKYAPAVAQTAIVVVVTYLSITFGELVPKRIGMSISERVAKIVAHPMQLLSRIASPFVWLLSKSTSFIFGLLHIDETSNKVTEEEIQSMIQEGTNDGEVQPVEQDIVQRVFMLGDLKVSSIMTHKNDIVWLDTGMNPAEVSKVMEEEMHDFYPIADGNLDHIEGVIYLKDLVLSLHKPGFCLTDHIRKTDYFPENMEVYKVLEQMKKKKISRGLVCDEFGSCIGVVTLWDIMEGLVGNMDDPNEEPAIIKRANNGGWLVDGQCPFYDFLCYFDRLDLFEDADYHTLSGLLLQYLQHIPQSGEVLTWKNFTFEIVDMDGARIDKVLVTTTLPPKDPS